MLFQYHNCVQFLFFFVTEHDECSEDFAVVIGVDADDVDNSHLYKISLHHQSDSVSPWKIYPLQCGFFLQLPFTSTQCLSWDSEKLLMKYGNTMFSSDWKRCGSLVQGRQGYCAEFIDETLYICGGMESYVVTDSIEPYNATTENNTMVGQLRFAFREAACIAYKSSVYVFAGLDKKNREGLYCVQVFNPVNRTCTVLSTPITCPFVCLRALTWETCTILLGCDTCFIFDLDGKTLEERNQFEINKLTYTNSLRIFFKKRTNLFYKRI